ncbi:MAG: DUF2461 domain-containing protein [Acidobacteria bacterium]|nr:DUF2461 domain-containing protein [Acidobacteriota bacterium]
MTFSGLSLDGWHFLCELQAHNDRSWFQQQQQRYKKHLQAPALSLVETLESALTTMIGHEMNGKVFRIHRDVRFSKDKTPYNTHLRFAIKSSASDRCNPAFFFSLEPERCVLGTGIFEFDKNQLLAFRRALDTPYGAQMDHVVEETKAKGFDYYEPDLKRVPSGFASDHPRGHWLRCKGLSCWRSMPVAEELFDDRCLAFFLTHYQDARPLFDWLEGMPL